MINSWRYQDLSLFWDLFWKCLKILLNAKLFKFSNNVCMFQGFEFECYSICWYICTGWNRRTTKLNWIPTFPKSYTFSASRWADAMYIKGEEKRKYYLSSLSPPKNSLRPKKKTEFKELRQLGQSYMHSPGTINTN